MSNQAAVKMASGALRRMRTASPAVPGVSSASLQQNLCCQVQRSSSTLASVAARSMTPPPLPVAMGPTAIATASWSSAAVVDASEIYGVASGSGMYSATPDVASHSLDEPGLLMELGMDKDELQRLALKSPTPLRLADMYRYGTGTDLAQRLRNAQFLYRELPIRIAQRAVDLLTLPHGLSQALPIQQVAQLYLGYLQKFKEIHMPQTIEDEEMFTDLIQSLILDRHSIPVSIARGVTAWRDDRMEDLEIERLQEMEQCLNRFFTARVGFRFLIEHHVLSAHRNSSSALRNTTNMFPPDEGDEMLGCIQTNCDLIKEVRKVAELVTRQTEEYYGVCPQIEIVDCIQEEEKRFTYVPHHLHYMVAELLKNSCRATIRRTRDSVNAYGEHVSMPPVRAVIVKGGEDVTIKVADKGGGIPRSLMAKIWKFAHSTADEEETNTDFGFDTASGARIRGFGLPLARIYARYFGGELTLKSMEGYGVDAYLHLPRLGDSCENLPLRVRSSPGAGDSMPHAAHARGYMTATNPPSDSTRQHVREGGHDGGTEFCRKQYAMSVLRSRAL